MKIAGHTMGTPEYTVTEAIQLFHNIGIDGAEIVVQNGYYSGISAACTREELDAIRECAHKYNIEICCLTPYNSYFNDLDDAKRNADIADVARVIDACAYVGAHFIRIYGGNLTAGDTACLSQRRTRLVESMRCLGDKAAASGVTLVIENHFNTMCVSARDTYSIVKEIHHPNVKILYDQANLSFTGNETYEEAIAIQQREVAYMHVKDLVFKEGIAFSSDEVSHPVESKRNVYTRIIGEGVIAWPEILRLVKEHGYDGWLSMEYERRWHPYDIPDASIGMKRGADYLLSIMRSL